MRRSTMRHRRVAVLQHHHRRRFGAGKSKMRAPGVAMRKPFHITFGVLKHHKPFNPNLVALTLRR